MMRMKKMRGKRARTGSQEVNVGAASFFVIQPVFTSNHLSLDFSGLSVQNPDHRRNMPGGDLVRGILEKYAILATTPFIQGLMFLFVKGTARSPRTF